MDAGKTVKVLDVMYIIWKLEERHNFNMEEDWEKGWYEALNEVEWALKEMPDAKEVA